MHLVFICAQYKSGAVDPIMHAVVLGVAFW